MVRREIANLLFVGSIPTLASIFVNESARNTNARHPNIMHRLGI